MNVEAAIAVGVPVAVVLRLATAALTMALGGHGRTSVRVAMSGSILASMVTLLVAVYVIVTEHAVAGTLMSHAASGITAAYAVTPLSAWFLLVLTLVAIPVAVYSVGYFGHAVALPRMAVVGVAFNVLLGAVELVFVADDIVTFLFAWELMTLATTALVATEHEDRASRRAAYLYLVMSHVGTGCLVIGFFILAAASGQSSFSMLLTGVVPPGPARDGLFALFFVGFGVKAGIIPLHVWLPEAHPAAPSSVSALMSAVLITAGLYGLFRVCAFGLGTPEASWGLACMGFGALSAILGVLYALAQRDLKRLLAYSTIENSGIIVLGLGAGMVALAYGHATLATAAVVASLVHVLNHALFKGLLFLGAGGVVMATGTRAVEQLGGLVHRMPWTALFFFIGAMAISGLPILNGFTSEWLLFQALLGGFASVSGLVRLNFPLAGALLALTSALAAACFVRTFGLSFLALPRSPAAADARESPAIMLLPQALLAALCLASGLFPGVVLRSVRAVPASLPGLQAPRDAVMAPLTMVSPLGLADRVVPMTLAACILAALAIGWIGWRATARRRPAVRRVATWGCGGELSARTEYTPTAFSKPLVMIFRAVYRPTRQVEALADASPYFPHEVRYHAVIEPTFERYVYGPLVRTVMRVAHGMKVLQAGSLHAYLGYVLALGIVLLIWLGGMR